MHAADLDGDGLTDLWGEVDHELRAFRGEAPEAWAGSGPFIQRRRLSICRVSPVVPSSRILTEIRSPMFCLAI